MTGEALQISPANDPRGSPAKEQQVTGVGIILQITMLVLSFVLGHVLRRHKFYYLLEASASLLIGLIVGALANISNTETNIRAWFNFHEEFFFLFLLPPIIFQSGFSLSPKPFFSNFGAIVTFAIFGTFLASMVTGILVWRFVCYMSGEDACFNSACKHIFCKDYVSEWFERERACPLCRALVKAADLISFGDGSTSLFFQIF